jgi:regulator of sigma E protease
MSLEQILAFVFVLGAVIVIHEGGHFLVAKAVGIYVKTFSVGFGPKLLRYRWRGTEYALSAVPFGGYVKMAGEGVMEEIQDAGTGGEVDAEGVVIPESQYFSSKNPWQRMAVVVAGPVANLLLTLVVCIGLAWGRGVPVIPTTTLGEVAEDSPAAAAGLQSGDEILSVAGQEVSDWGALVDAIVDESEAGRFPIEMRYLRDGRTAEVGVTPTRDAESGRWRVGIDYLPDTRVGKVKKEGPAWRAGLREGDLVVSINGEPMHDYSQIATIVNESIDEPLEIVWTRGDQEFRATVVPEAAEVPTPDLESVRTIGRIQYEPYREMRPVNLVQAVSLGAGATWRMVDGTVSFLGKLVTGHASRDAVSGPVRIAQFAGEMVQWGFDYLLGFLALFSVNLFLLNLLPVPVLDGGHAVFIGYELVTRRRPNERVQMVATQVGFVLLLLLMAFVITMDVIKVAS